MANLKRFPRAKKLLEKEIFIRLTADGFVSTARYAGLFRKSAAWDTRPSEVASKVEAFTPSEWDEPEGSV